MKKSPSGRRCRDSNRQPLEYESPPITTRLGSRQCDHIWRNFATLCKKFNVFGNFLEGYFSTWQNFDPIRANYYTFGQIFIVVNGQILNKNIFIWTHWLPPKPDPNLTRSRSFMKISVRRELCLRC